MNTNIIVDKILDNDLTRIFIEDGKVIVNSDSKFVVNIKFYITAIELPFFIMEILNAKDENTINYIITKYK